MGMAPTQLRVLKEPCGLWQYTMSKRNAGSKKSKKHGGLGRWLGTCKSCGKKRSLMGAVVADLDTREEAEEFVRKLNEEYSAKGLI